MKYITYPKLHNRFNTQFKLRDDMGNHCKSWENFLVRNSITTETHELSHGVSSELRMSNHSFTMFSYQETDIDIVDGVPHPKAMLKNCSYGQGKKNGFYLFNDKAVILEEPSMRKSHTASFVISDFRLMRFGTYITGQTAWDDTPLYIYDEWNAYIAGTECAIELGKMGNNQPKGTDIAMGPIEFAIYSLAMCMACEKHDKEYLTKEFLEFTNSQLQRSIKATQECLTYFDWPDTRKVLDKFFGEPGKAYRKFLEDRIDTKLTRKDFDLV